jgi:outer membrane protein OmpA-like peptidoglycan-associated protein
MFRKSIIVTLVLSVLAGPALAENASREESTGVGLGALIGGVAGGPPGAIIGAAIGAKIGDGYHQKKTDIAALNASLARSESDVGRLQHDIRQLEGKVAARDTELSRVRELARPELLALLKAGIEMDLLFRTDEDVLSDSTGLKVQELAQSLTRNTDVLIRLDGYADERGDEQYNQALSARRVEHVRDMLVTAGVPAERITVSAHGESPAAEQNADSFALERRVSLTLYVDETPSFASNPR